jgi:D-amino-acid oxidase
MAERCVVVGSGVIGLSVAVRLAEAGEAVEVVTASAWPGTTSRVAGAVWHPYLVEGRHVLRWAAESYRCFAELAASGAPGVRMATLWELDSEGGTLGVDRGWTALASGYRELGAAELPSGWVGGRQATVPVIHTGRYLPYLLGRLQAAGGTLRVATLSSLAEAGPAGVVVNCTGLGAAALCDDRSMRPIRGQVVVVANPGIERTVVSDAGVYAIAHPDEVVLGGTAEVGAESLEIDPDTAERIRAEAGALGPGLADAPVLEGRVGLRPWRPEPRVELDPDPPPGVGRLVHCYGHGGAGVTLSWGSAADVLTLLAG